MKICIYCFLLSCSARILFLSFLFSVSGRSALCFQPATNRLHHQPRKHGWFMNDSHLLGYFKLMVSNEYSWCSATLWSAKRLTLALFQSTIQQDLYPKLQTPSWFSILRLISALRITRTFSWDRRALPRYRIEIQTHPTFHSNVNSRKPRAIIRSRLRPRKGAFLETDFHSLDAKHGFQISSTTVQSPVTSPQKQDPQAHLPSSRILSFRSKDLATESAHKVEEFIQTLLDSHED
jgi:hypothetical protein